MQLINHGYQLTCISVELDVAAYLSNLHQLYQKLTMYNRLSNTSRNQRSKGIRVKHILQICLLVAVCFWLVYQVKRSHDKRNDFDENDANLVSETQHDGEIPRLGRKDISRVRETVRDDKLHGEEGEENDADDEENKHEEGEQEREESRTEDREEEDTGKGGEGDEIDKHEEEKTDDENHEEIIDAEGSEEGDEKSEDDDGSKHEDKDMVLEDLDQDQDQDGEARNAHKEDNEEIETVLEDQDHDREAGNTDKEDNEESETVLEDRDQDHEAREEHYKADDASSEVVHDTKTVLPDTVNATLKSELVSDGKENASQNSTTLKEFNDRYQTSNNSTQLESEHSIDTSQAQNATLEDSNSKDFNKSMSLLSSANVSEIASDKNQLNVKTDMNDTHHVISTPQGSLSLSGEVKSTLAENTTVSLETKVDTVNSTIARTDKDTDSDSENVTAEENDTSISEAENENDNAGDFHDPVEDIDSSLTQEEKEYRTDLGTLPDIKAEVENAEDVEAE